MNPEDVKGYSIKWTAPEYYHIPKTADWFWAVGIIAASIVVLSFIYGDVLLGILILIGTFSVFLHANKESVIREIELDEKGIRIDRRFFPYRTLDSFWIDAHEFEHDEYGNIVFAKLLVKSKKTFMPLIVIVVEYPDTEEIREFLSIFLPEEEHRESLAHKLAEYFGF